MPYKNLDGCLPNLGLSDSQVKLGKLEPEDIKISQVLYKYGGVIYIFFKGLHLISISIMLIRCSLVIVSY